MIYMTNSIPNKSVFSFRQRDTACSCGRCSATTASSAWQSIDIFCPPGTLLQQLIDGADWRTDRRTPYHYIDLPHTMWTVSIIRCRQCTTKIVHMTFAYWKNITWHRLKQTSFINRQLQYFHDSSFMYPTSMAFSWQSFSSLIFLTFSKKEVAIQSHN